MCKNSFKKKERYAKKARVIVFYHLYFSGYLVSNFIDVYLVLFYLVGSFPVSGHYSKCELPQDIPGPPQWLHLNLSPGSSPIFPPSHGTTWQLSNTATTQQNTSVKNQKPSCYFHFLLLPSCFPWQVITIYRPSPASITAALFTLWLPRNIARTWPGDTL